MATFDEGIMMVSNERRGAPLTEAAKQAMIEDAYNDLVPKGRLPKRPILRAVENEAAALAEARAIVLDYLTEIFEFADPGELARLSGRQMIELLEYYINRPVSIEHFKSMVESVAVDSDEADVRGAVKEIAARQDLERLLSEPDNEVLANVYGLYLFHKLPVGIKAQFFERPGFDLADAKVIAELENIHAKRGQLKDMILLGFHSSGKKFSSDRVSVPQTEEQVMELLTGEKIKVRGAKYLTFDPGNIFKGARNAPAKYLTLVEFNYNLLSRVYNAESAAAFSNAAIDIIGSGDPDNPCLLKNLPISDEVFKEFGLAYIKGSA